MDGKRQSDLLMKNMKGDGIEMEGADQKVELTIKQGYILKKWQMERLKAKTNGN